VARKYTDQTLKSIISEMLKNSGMEKKFNELEVIRCYNEVVGEVIQKKTRSIFIRDKTLIVRMDSGVMKQELLYQKTKIVGLVNERLGHPFLEQLEVW
jgi:predicted nucleic acid-binding Zn ribbon protein